jgi:6-phosphofructokinase 2
MDGLIMSAMPLILTLTMNPALDISTSVDKVLPTHKLRCTTEQIHAGGGGINVARVVHRLGGACVAVFPRGGVTGRELQQLLDAEQVPLVCVDIAGETRQSFSAHETSTGLDYRFVLPGPTLSEPDWLQCLSLVEAQHAPAGLVVASGSLPPGVPVDFYARLALMAEARGFKLVLDTSGAALAEALKVGVYLVKPSLRELQEFTGLPLQTDVQQRDAARHLIAQGAAKVVALSLGDEGALLVTADQAWRAASVPVRAVSTIGAGDSFVGGMVWALSQGKPLEDAFRYGMAAGAAAVMNVGTGLCQAADVHKIHDAVSVSN